MRLLLVALVLTFSATSASAGEYFRSKWFTYPDPTTLPRVNARCVKEASGHVLCPTSSNPFRTCLKSTCVGHAYTTELLRVSAEFVVSGPDNVEDGVRRAAQGIAAACAAKAIFAGKAAAAAVPSPEPGARIAAAAGTGTAAFKVCITSVNMAATVGAVAKQFEFKIETPTHWARV